MTFSLNIGHSAATKASLRVLQQRSDWFVDGANDWLCWCDCGETSACRISCIVMDSFWVDQSICRMHPGLLEHQGEGKRSPGSRREPNGMGGDGRSPMPIGGGIRPGSTDLDPGGICRAVARHAVTMYGNSADPQQFQPLRFRPEIGPASSSGDQSCGSSLARSRTNPVKAAATDSSTEWLLRNGGSERSRCRSVSVNQKRLQARYSWWR